MSFAGPSNYSFFQIIKTKLESYKSGQGLEKLKARSVNEKKVRIEGKIVGVNYFESVYSPMVTEVFYKKIRVVQLKMMIQVCQELLKILCPWRVLRMYCLELELVLDILSLIIKKINVL